MTTNRLCGMVAGDVQQLSRDAELEALMRYDDVRNDKQRKVRRLLRSLINLFIKVLFPAGAKPLFIGKF